MLLTTRFPATVGLRPRRQGAAGRARPPAEPFCAEGPDLLNRARGANGSPGGSPSRVNRARGANGSPEGSPSRVNRARGANGSPGGSPSRAVAPGRLTLRSEQIHVRVRRDVTRKMPEELEIQ